MNMTKYLLKLKYIIVFQVFTALLSIVGIASMPYVVKLLFDYDFSKGVGGMIWIVFLYLLSIALGMFFEYCSQRSVWKFRQRFYCLVKQDLFEALLRKRYVDFKKYDLSDYLSFFQNDVDVFRQYLESCITIFQTVLQLFVYAFFLFSLDARLAILIILSSFVSLLVPKLTGKQLSQRKALHLTAMANYTDTIRDLLSGFRLVNHETREAISQRHLDSIEQTEETEYQFGKYKTLTNVVTGSSMYFLQSIVFAVLGYLLFQKQITVGTASAALGYIQDFCYPVSYILKDINNVNASRAGKDKILKLLAEGKEKAPDECIERFQKDIQFQDVSVQLGDFCFSHFTHTFQKGKKYAIIGPSGVGKSTILNLLMQYIVPDQGKICMDGNSISGKDTSKMIVCVNQFEHIFHASFTQNATLFESYPLSRMRSALRYFDNEKLNSLLQKDNAQELSGGENQMMQLIRAITADKPIMLMDESFSAVDVNNTNQLREKLLSLDKTIIFVTHDVSAEHLKLYDEIIVLQHGKIVEQGSFLQLMEKQQYFYHLYHTSEK